MRHVCDEAPRLGLGRELREDAITRVVHRHGRWWARNAESRTAIVYCPFCGWELPEEVPDPDQLLFDLRA